MRGDPAQLAKAQAELSQLNAKPAAQPTVNPHELKGLETQLAKAKADLELLKSESARVAEREFAAHNTVLAIHNQIKRIKELSVEPLVSEHAILRWLEHVRGVDLDEVRRDILSAGTRDAIMFAGSGKHRRGGVTIVFQNKTVVTVTKDTK